MTKARSSERESAEAVFKLAVLHKHWLHADSIKERIRLPIRDAEKSKLPDDFLAIAKAFSDFLAMSVWYALLYVVVEGYRELKLDDAEINRLLEQGEYVDLLRRFRNAVLHYQEDPLPEKLMAFLTAKDSEKWIWDLNRAFDVFFASELQIKEIMGKIQKDFSSTRQD